MCNFTNLCLRVSDSVRYLRNTPASQLARLGITQTASVVIHRLRQADLATRRSFHRPANSAESSVILATTSVNLVLYRDRRSDPTVTVAWVPLVCPQLVVLVITAEDLFWASFVFNGMELRSEDRYRIASRRLRESHHHSLPIPSGQGMRRGTARIFVSRTIHMTGS
jgi:hypothetical protein